MGMDGSVIVATKVVVGFVMNRELRVSTGLVANNKRMMSNQSEQEQVQETRQTTLEEFGFEFDLPEVQPTPSPSQAAHPTHVIRRARVV